MSPNVVENEKPKEGLEHYTPNRSGQEPNNHRLKVRLSEALVSGSTGIALSWPAEWDEQHGEADSYVLKNFGRGDWDEFPDDLELNHLLLPVAERDAGQRLAALKRARVQALDSDGNSLSREIAGDRWITAEIDLDGKRYIFYQGRWFNIGGAYISMLHNKMSRTLAIQAGVQLPSWPKEVKKDGRTGRASEGTYNEHSAAVDDKLMPG